MDIKITYETLFEFLRLEKGKDELQTLEPEFFSHVQEYLAQKQKIIDDNSDKGLFGNDEREKTILQMQQIRKILKDFYERREKKIVELALIKSRTGSDLISTSHLLAEEKEMLNHFQKILDAFRVSVLGNVLSGKIPELPGLKTSEAEQEPSAPIRKKAVKLKKAVPQFMGTELEVYGPFEAGDVANLPEKIANLLVQKDRAEFV